ncbi:MAG: MarP family serine protease [Candidatus Saccharimonadales bacterium]
MLELALVIVDIIIAVFFIAALFRGRELGFVRQLLSAIGFFAGLIIGALIEPHFMHFAHSQGSRLLLTLVITLGSAIILLIVGEFIGIKIKQHLSDKLANKLDAGAGSIAGGAALLVAAWLVAAVLVTVPLAGLQSSIENSYVINHLNNFLPPAPPLIAKLGYLLNPNGFPQVFLGGEPSPPGGVVAPNISGQLKLAVEKDAKSVVKVEGLGCGGLVEGSGFVAGNGLVATNAHVVAGIEHPFVLDDNGQHSAQVIYFDPNLDFSVLKVSDLAGPPLAISTRHLDPSTAGAVMGYPGGGGLESDGAAVIDSFIAVGRNIYNQGETSRQVLELKAKIVPGNSGGPLIATDGDVVGVVFAKSVDYNGVGYALATNRIKNELASATKNQQPVLADQCAS